jgi:glycerol uptake facilitator-like aquaporin
MTTEYVPLVHVDATAAAADDSDFDDDLNMEEDEQILGTGFVFNKSVITKYDPLNGVHETPDGHEVRTFERVWKEAIGTIFLVALYIIITTSNSQMRIGITNKAATYIGAAGPVNSTVNGTAQQITLDQTYIKLDPPPTYTFTHGANVLVALNEHEMTIENPSAPLLNALIMAILVYLAHRAMPGCTFNPWLTIAHHGLQWRSTGEPLTRAHIHHSRLVTFMVVAAQFVCCILAVLIVLMWHMGNGDLLGDTLPTSLVKHDTEIMIYEGLASFFLLLMLSLFSQPIRNVTAREQSLFIAAIHFVLMLALIPYTGGSLNFARSLGSASVHAMVSGHAPPLNLVWYGIGQLAGYGCAAVCVKIIHNAFVDARKKAD